MTTPISDIGRQRQREIYTAGVAGIRPRVPVSPDALERAAQAAMSPEAWAYIAGGAGREATMDHNRAAFGRWRIVPRVLRDCETRDLSITLCGRTLPTPLLLSPIGVLDMAHPHADLAVGRAAASLGVPFIFSNQASVSMETVAAAMGDAPRWFQLYWSRSDEVVGSFVRRAEACGCSALVLTLDTTMLGWRPRDLDLGSLPFLHGRGIAQYTSDPVFLRQLHDPLEGPPAATPPLRWQTLRAALLQKARFPGGLWRNLTSPLPRAAVQRFLATYSRPSIEWSRLSFLREHTRLPIVLKGVLHPDDARRAVEAGIDGLIVSNHGGRQIDGSIAALDALPAVVNVVQGRLPVILDSGVRGGADVFTALALGATAVSIGRPYVYGLAVDGQRGVDAVVRNILAELDLTMGLSGCRTIADITPAALQHVAAD